MIRMTKEQINEVLIAFAEGKAIEYRSPSLPNVWYDCDDEIPIFDFKKYDFRIKKKELFKISTFEDTNNIKETQYFGFNVKIESKYKWIATDNDGLVYAYEEKPKFPVSFKKWKTCGDYKHIGNSTFIGNPEDSLMEIK